jgi:hypothetical protein
MSHRYYVVSLELISHAHTSRTQAEAKETEEEKAMRIFQEAEGYDASSFSAWESHQDEIRVKVDEDVVRVSPLAGSGLRGTEQIPGGFGAVVRCDLNEVVGNPQAFEALVAALHEHGVLLFKGQQGLDPAVLAAFTRKFDEASPCESLPDLNLISRTSSDGVGLWHAYEQRSGAT